MLQNRLTKTQANANDSALTLRMVYGALWLEPYQPKPTHTHSHTLLMAMHWNALKRDRTKMSYEANQIAMATTRPFVNGCEANFSKAPFWG